MPPPGMNAENAVLTWIMSQMETMNKRMDDQLETIKTQAAAINAQSTGGEYKKKQDGGLAPVDR